jgi:hypothetical protein
MLFKEYVALGANMKVCCGRMPAVDGFMTRRNE